MQVVLVILIAKPIPKAAYILISSYFLKHFLIVMGHIAEGEEELKTFPDVDRFYRKKHSCLGFLVDHNFFQHGGINSHVRAGK